MKIIQTLILFLLISSGSSLLAQSDTVWNQLNDKKQKVGQWRDYHSSGFLRYEGQFENGKPFGIFKYYFPNGDLQSILEFKTASESYATHYYQNGDKMASGKYLNQKKDSIWTSYGAESIMVEKGGYINGKKFGSWKTYYASGQVSEDIFFENDLENGPMKVYFENGQLKQEANYENGFMQGLCTFYDTEGHKTLKGMYYKGSRDGRWIYYKELLEVEKVLEYDKGKLLNPEDQELIEDSEEVKRNVKDVLEFEDLKGNIKYD